MTHGLNTFHPFFTLCLHWVDACNCNSVKQCFLTEGVHLPGGWALPLMHLTTWKFDQ